MENTMIQKSTSKHIHRIGTITFGCTLISFGVLFLLHMFFPLFSYELIFHLWPCILILLGMEVLIGHYKEGGTFVYDKTSVFLLVVLSFFAMAMALIDFFIQNYPNYFYY